MGWTEIFYAVKGAEGAGYGGVFLRGEGRAGGGGYGAVHAQGEDNVEAALKAGGVEVGSDMDIPVEGAGIYHMGYGGEKAAEKGGMGGIVKAHIGGNMEQVDGYIWNDGAEGGKFSQGEHHAAEGFFGLFAADGLFCALGSFNGGAEGRFWTYGTECGGAALIGDDEGQTDGDMIQTDGGHDKRRKIWHKKRLPVYSGPAEREICAGKDFSRGRIFCARGEYRICRKNPDGRGIIFRMDALFSHGMAGIGRK